VGGAPSPLAALDHDALRALVASQGVPASHADRIVRHVLRRGAPSLRDVPGLGPRVASALGRVLSLRETRSVGRTDSLDGTTKLLLATRDGQTVESVLMPLAQRYSGCLSSQVGCGAGCRFCASGSLGLRRSLEAHEIVEQALALADLARERGRRLDNLVFMGMGEPLHAYEAVVGAIRRLTDPRLLGFGPSRITVSTVGVVPGIDALAGEGLGVHLAVSVHAADDGVRRRLLPVGGHWSVAEVLDAAERFRVATGRFVTVQVTLIRDVNDGERDAVALADAIAGRPFHVNLIPLNRVEGASWEPPAPDRVEAFRRTLVARRCVTHVRARRGADADAACGQLRRRLAPDAAGRGAPEAPARP
jgi:23S rRNA (adenine2503-C2)-methyltransferase